MRPSRRPPSSPPQEVTNARVAAATRDALYMLGLNPSQHGPVQAAVAAASTGSSVFPRMVLPVSPRASACNSIPAFHVYPHASRLSGECSPDVSVVAPSTPAPAPINLNATPAFQALEAFKVQHNGKCFNLSRCYRVIKDEEKCKTQYAALKARGGKKAVEDVGEGEPARPRGKTNSKKENKRDADTNALIASVDGMMNKKDSREEERRRFKAEQMDAFMEIQKRRLEMDAEKQAKMFELEAEKQTKMLEIEAANAKTKAKEVALASMMTGVEIMKVDLNTVSPRKRQWFEKMQADMLKFDDE
ncbi:hypothetical protein VPH35_118551 [Triticum aestivum]